MLSSGAPRGDSKKSLISRSSLIVSSFDDIRTPPGRMIGRLRAGLNSGSRRSTAALNFFPAELVRKARIGRALSAVGTLRAIIEQIGLETLVCCKAVKTLRKVRFAKHLQCHATARLRTGFIYDSCEHQVWVLTACRHELTSQQRGRSGPADENTIINSTVLCQPS
jgi:hypothetical protein